MADPLPLDPRIEAVAIAEQALRLAQDGKLYDCISALEHLLVVLSPSTQDGF